MRILTAIASHSSPHFLHPSNTSAPARELSGPMWSPTNAVAVLGGLRLVSFGEAPLLFGSHLSIHVQIRGA